MRPHAPPSDASRLTAILALALLLAADIAAPIAVASHDTDLGEAASSVGSLDLDALLLRDNPTLRGFREDIFEMQRNVIAQIGQRAEENNATPDHIYRLPARVFFDPVDEGGRIGGLGDWRAPSPWRTDARAAGSSTAAWTITNASSGTYPTMDAILISPAIDLAAYPVDTYPFISKSTGTRDALSPISSPCNTALSQASPERCPSPPDLAAIRDQINLVFTHRYRFVEDADGAQVLLYTAPPTSPDARPYVLRPMPFYGEYEASVAALDGAAGFTGTRGWEVAAFDLTPWAGRTVWVGFRAASTPAASDDPARFEKGGAPYGWAIDDIEVRAPAYPVNLKVEDVTGPAFRALPGDHEDRVAPDTNATYTVRVLNAGASTREARLRITTTGLDHDIDMTRARVLKSGEVWVETIAITSPSEEGRLFTVNARASTPGGNGVTLPDPTPADNVGSRAFLVSAVSRMRATLTPSALIVDDAQPVNVTARIENTGNVPLTPVLDLRERYGAAETQVNVTHAPQKGLIAPGDVVEFTWETGSATRGEHAFLLNVTAPGTTTNATARYYVHASPPDLFFDAGIEAEPGWEPRRSDWAVPDLDEWMWVARSSNYGGGALLRAGTQPAAARGTFTDLRIDVRFMSYDASSGARIELGYVQPVAALGGMAHVVWKHDLDVSTQAGEEIARVNELSWQTRSIVVDPQAADGYFDTWDAQPLEVRVIFPAGGGTNDTGFFLDRLVLTGVPTGEDPSRRIDLVRVTGGPEDQTTVRPAEPSVCIWETPIPTPFSAHCWRRVHRSQALAAISTSHWQANANASVPSTLSGHPALFTYRATDAARYTDRLISPPMTIVQADDPVLSVLHTYAFPSSPADVAAEAKYLINQVGVVEMQYMRDDGAWSSFVRLDPEGGYDHVLRSNTAGKERVKGAPSFRAFDGFYHPGPCTGPGCDAGGFTQNKAEDGTNLVVWYAPLEPRRSTFRLEAQPALSGVDLSGRAIRIAFHASHMLPPAQWNPAAEWIIGDVRVTPVSRFAIDGEVQKVGLDLPYDWRDIGVGPGTQVPVNVTVRNAGMYAESFIVNLTFIESSGGIIATSERSIGQIPAGETRDILMPWEVPATEDRLYGIVARVRPAGGIEDENIFNDAAHLGELTPIRASTRVDLAVRAAIFPATGRDGLARYIPISVRNEGNIELSGVEITRTVDLIAGGLRERVDSVTWRLAKSVEPTTAAVPFERLDPRQGTLSINPDAAFFTPSKPGTYLVTITVRAPKTDADPDDDQYRGFLVAQDALAFDDFEGSLRWHAGNDSDVWGVGPGFRSERGLVATNRTTHQLSPRLDATIISPRIALSGAQSAIVNLFMRHDLEPGYDAARLEVTTDGVQWLPVPALAPDGRVAKGDAIVPSNPLGGDPAAPPRAITGDSRRSAFHLDGWIPASFDLGAVPGLAEAVGFRRLEAPTPSGIGLSRILDGIYVAPWMVEDNQDPVARWEIQKPLETIKPLDGTAFWSGLAETSGTTRSATLERTFSLDDVDRNATFVLSWWDWRAGATPTDWTGVGAAYEVHTKLVKPDGTKIDVTGAIKPIAQRGGWTRLSMTLQPGLNTSLELEVRFSHVSQRVTANNLGWLIEEIDLRATTIESGALITKKRYTEPDELDQTRWLGDAWTRVLGIPSTPAPWEVVTLPDAQGVQRPQWRLALGEDRSNIDARLVTPAVDLSKVVGTPATLSLTHSYDLYWNERVGGTDPAEWKYFQAGVVEVQVFNRTKGTWDPWRQLFNATPPTDALVPRAANHALDTGPYTHTLADIGQPFDRFPRSMVIRKSSWGVPLDANLSYAFSGASGGRVTSEFDLSPYRGERVRFGFHAATGAVDLLPATARHWTLESAEVIGYVLSAPDVELRLRVATDASIPSSAWEIDQFEVTGVRYGHSIGIHIDDMQREVAPGGAILIRGNLTNFGPTDRRGVAVALWNDSFDRAIGIDTPVAALAGSPYAIIAGPFDLTAAGTNGSRAPFTVHVTPGARTTHRMQLEVVEAGVAGSSFTFAPPKDDVPGRAARAWSVVVSPITRLQDEPPALSPRSLARPGAVDLLWRIHNTGTLPLTTDARIVVQDESRTITHDIGVPVGPIDVGTFFDLQHTVTVATLGNHTFHLSLASGEVRQLTFRVGRSDVAFVEDFERDETSWTIPTGGRIVSGEAAHAGRWLLIDPKGQAAATLRSPRIDLRGLQEGATLAFSHMPRFDRVGSVSVYAAPTPGCMVRLDSGEMRGLSTEWRRAELSLDVATCGGGRLLDGAAEFVFVVSDDKDGWGLDALSIASGRIIVAPDLLDYLLVDSAVKEYPVRITNPGLVPKAVELDLDLAASKLTEAQRAWFEIEPPHVLIAPGGEVDVLVRVTAPPARGAFAHTVRAVIRATDAAVPVAPALAELTLAFTPRPRADLHASVMLDTALLGTGSRPSIEEGVPHEIAIIVTNIGTDDAPPTRLRVTITDDANHETIFTQEDRVPSLGRRAVTDDSAVFSFSWKPAFGRRGNHTVHVTLDPDREQVDYDRSNDDLRLPIAVGRLIRPDVAIDARELIVRTPDGRRIHEATAGALVRVEGIVRNIGLADARDVTIRLLAGNSVLKEELIPLLKVGDAYTLAANQFAPNDTIAYRILAFTPDAEITGDNNERKTELPIVPQELVFDRVDPMRIAPGAAASQNVTLRNLAPYPVLVDARLVDDRSATLTPERVALAAGEARELTLAVATTPRDPAGTRSLVLRAETGEGLVTRRTIDIEVDAMPAARAIPAVARGPPADIRLGVDIANQGNVRLDLDAILIDDNGTELLRTRLAPLAAGTLRFESLAVSLPAALPPGARAATLRLANEGEILTEANVTLDIEPWGRIRASATPRASGDGSQEFEITLGYDGNVPTLRRPMLVGAPAGVTASFERTEIALRPGEETRITLRVDAPRDTKHGLYHTRAGFIDWAVDTTRQGFFEDAATVPLDLRRAALELATVRRIQEAPRDGDTVGYVVSVKNHGDRAAHATPVALYVDGLLRARVIVETIEPGKTVETRLSWDAHTGTHVVVIAVDPSGPHGNDMPAFTESLRVGESLLAAVIPGKGVPLGPPVILLALALGVWFRRRAPPRE